MMTAVALILTVLDASSGLAATQPEKAAKDTVSSPTYGPPAPVSPKPTPAKSTPKPRCDSMTPEDINIIVVCGVRPQTYRIDPDILKAQRQARDHNRPKPSERYVDTNCQVVGTAGCMNAPAIDLLKVVTVVATMAQKAVKGENIGAMFVTRPELSEYELYRIAKGEREAKEAMAVAVKEVSDSE